MHQPLRHSLWTQCPSRVKVTVWPEAEAVGCRLHLLQRGLPHELVNEANGCWQGLLDLPEATATETDIVYRDSNLVSLLRTGSSENDRPIGIGTGAITDTDWSPPIATPELAGLSLKMPEKECEPSATLPPTDTW